MANDVCSMANRFVQIDLSVQHVDVVWLIDLCKSICQPAYGKLICANRFATLHIFNLHRSTISDVILRKIVKNYLADLCKSGG